MDNQTGKPAFPRGIYGITAEKFSNGRSNVEVARQMIAGGIRLIQYREKRPHKSFGAMLEECRLIRRLTREAGVLFIINDYPALALLEVRKLIGPDKLIGLSTHGPEQAAAAVAGGADYIGVGPIYSTRTKEDVCAPVGLEYLDHVIAHSPLPFVAIGGIKEHNLAEVLAHGATTICLVTEIVGADDITATVRRLQAACR
jgi:thiamine-phosphate pyrophosphorylase